MSYVDTNFLPAERLGILAEVRDYLPGFLSTAVEEGLGVLSSLDALMNLHEADLNRVIAVHLALSPEVASFAESLPRGLRSPVTESQRPRVTTQAVRGPIDWGATIRTRSAAGNDPTLFVVRPARRIFNAPENQALLWTLLELDRRLRQARAAESAADSGVHDDQWFVRVVRVRNVIATARRHAWLTDVDARRPSSATIRRLMRARRVFYRERLLDAYRLLARYAATPSPADVTTLLTQRYFEPSQDWRLFEVAVALRLSRAFAAVGKPRPQRLLVGSEGSRRPFASFELPSGTLVALEYQSWPAGAGTSVHRETRLRHKIAAGANRPDIVITATRDGVLVDAVVLELKATRSPRYLADGISQLLAYLKDRPALLHGVPAGWLVAPASNAFHEAEATDTDIWVTTADAVAAAAVKRFAAL